MESPGRLGSAPAISASDPVGLPAGLSAARAGVSAAVQGLERAWALTERQMVDCLLVTETMARAVDALRLGLIRAYVSRAPAGTSQAKRSAPARRVLEDICHYAPSRSGQLVADAQLIDPEGGKLAGLGAALGAGEVTLEHVDVARRCLRQLPATVVREHGPVLDELLTGHARRYHPQATRALAEHLLAVLGVEKDERDPDRGRYLSLAHSGGVTHISGQIDELTGRYLQTLLDILVHGGDPTAMTSPDDSVNRTPADDHGVDSNAHGGGAGGPDRLDAGPASTDSAVADAGRTENGDENGAGDDADGQVGILDLRSLAQRRADAFAELVALAGQMLSLVRDPDTGLPVTTGPGGQLNQRPSQAVPRLVLHLNDADHPVHGEDGADWHPDDEHHDRPGHADTGADDYDDREHDYGGADVQDDDGTGPYDEHAGDSGATADLDGVPAVPDRAGPRAQATARSGFTPATDACGWPLPPNSDDTGEPRDGMGGHPSNGAACSSRPPRPADWLTQPGPPGQPPDGRWVGFTATSQQLDPLTPHLSDLATCDAVLDLARFDGRGRLISFTSIGRIAGERLTAAVIARDRCCTFPGCTRPPAICQVHHVIWHRHGGPTDLDNLALLCGHHHRLVHSLPHGHPDAWTMAMRDGIPCFSPPEHLTPYGHDGPIWIRNTYATDHLTTRHTAHQLALDTG